MCKRLSASVRHPGSTSLHDAALGAHVPEFPIVSHPRGIPSNPHMITMIFLFATCAVEHQLQQSDTPPRSTQLGLQLANRERPSHLELPMAAVCKQLCLADDIRALLKRERCETLRRRSNQFMISWQERSHLHLATRLTEPAQVSKWCVQCAPRLKGCT